MRTALARIESEIRVLPAPTRAATVDDLPLIGSRFWIGMASADEILDAICQRYKITREELTGRGRCGDVLTPRFLAYFLLRHCAGLTWHQIGREMKRDHVTPMSGVKTLMGWMQTNEALSQAVQVWLMFFIKRPAALPNVLK